MLRAFLRRLVVAGRSPVRRWPMTWTPAATGRPRPRPGSTPAKSDRGGPGHRQGSRRSRYAVRGRRFMHKRNYDKAIAAFSAAHDADPDDAGYSSMRAASPMSARATTTTRWRITTCACRCARTSAVALQQPRHALSAQGRAAKRARRFQCGDQICSRNSISRYTNRARVLTINKDFDGALADFAEAEQIDPARAQIASYRCLTYTAMGKFDEAIADCNSVIEKAAEIPVRAGQPRRRLSGQGRSRCGAEGLQLRARPQPEQCARPCRPRPIVREAARPGAGARRLPLRRLCADAVRRISTSRMARQIARERLAALTPQAPAAPARSAASR